LLFVFTDFASGDKSKLSKLMAIKDLDITKIVSFPVHDPVLIVYFAPRNASISYDADYESLMKKRLKDIGSNSYLIFYSGLIL